ncbi:ESX secretion-associated protein EspG [Goodfellowiella coeruleoviolacea]|uniref:EspG family protein n=1 Tax=Goodfellowiella coeruleoviolacea TaxID=334858 RepID=A0AAE3G849_9PSEU|nr:ESX secretion-associated protein EspG [Goodfellowiella coeruleoviolacea]MCP2163466.1 EspG family protein [Goodfellowiella coeruleoviolacea]
MSVIAELSLPAFDVLWDDMELGAVPGFLQVRHHGETIAERARIKAAVYVDLERRGLVRRGRTEPDLGDALRLLAQHDIRLDAVALLDMAATDPINAVVVARGSYAVRAVQRERSITLDHLRDTGLATAITEVVPDNRPGTGRSVTMPVNDLKAGQRAPVQPSGGFTEAVRASGGSRGQDEARALAEIMARPVLRTGQFGVTLKNPHGRVHQLPGVSWFDTEAGRYLNVISPGPNGQDWVTVAPADNARIAQRLGQLLATA